MWDRIQSLFFANRPNSYWNSDAPETKRRALIVGIDYYSHVNSLRGCVADAKAMHEVLSRHDGPENAPSSLNYTCELLLGTQKGPEVNRKVLRSKWLDLFEDPSEKDRKFKGDVLFYFAGHGAINDYGGHLVTQESVPKDDEIGVEMEALMLLANRKSAARSVNVIIDACHSGEFGNPPDEDGLTKLKKGISILMASLPAEKAKEVGGRGVFTSLVVSALEGGGADVLGNVSAASIFAYAEAALGPQQQRPMYKTHASDWEVIRRCQPEVSLDDLGLLPNYFPESESHYQMDPSFEHTELENYMEGKDNHLGEPGTISEDDIELCKNNIKIFKLFKRYQVVGLLEPVKEQMKPGNENDLYWAAIDSKPVRLTRLGQFYQNLALNNRLTDGQDRNLQTLGEYHAQNRSTF